MTKRLDTFKSIAERAVNSTKIAELTDCEIALKEMVKFDSTPRTVLGGNRMLSPFGHNATAQNGDADFALCSGAVTLDEVVNKIHVYRKTRKADPQDRKATARCAINHMKFLAGINNGKNRLADRIARFIGKDNWGECVAMEEKVYSLMADIYPRMNEAFKRQYGAKAKA